MLDLSCLLLDLEANGLLNHCARLQLMEAFMTSTQKCLREPSLSFDAKVNHNIASFQGLVN